VTLRDSIARMRKRGYSFVTLDEATKDAAHQRPDTFTGSAEAGCSDRLRQWGRRLRSVPSHRCRSGSRICRGRLR